jgi:2,3-bisphosphoglycerate-independent phosphoglycerate mutase
VLDGLEDEPYRILIAPDHPTPVQKRTHTDEPVPFLLYGDSVQAHERFSGFCESEAANSPFYFDSGEKLMKYFLTKEI